MPSGTITQVTAQAQPTGQTQLKPQQLSQPQSNQSITNANFAAPQTVNGIRLATGPTLQISQNTGQPGPTLIAQNTGQIITTSGPGPQQQANVLLNQALGPIQTSNNQTQILTGSTGATATLVSQGQQSTQIHFNNQNVSFYSLFFLLL